MLNRLERILRVASRRLFGNEVSTEHEDLCPTRDGDEAPGLVVEGYLYIHEATLTRPVLGGPRDVPSLHVDRVVTTGGYDEFDTPDVEDVTETGKPLPLYEAVELVIVELTRMHLSNWLTTEAEREAADDEWFEQMSRDLDRALARAEPEEL